MERGIGVATTQHIDAIAALRYWRSSETGSSATTAVTGRPAPSLSARQLHDLLKLDLAIRDRLESILAQCNTTFMTDFDRLIASYRLPRALAYANRRLCDEIAILREIGAQMRLWTITQERRERVTVPVLHPYARPADAADAVSVADTALHIKSGDPLPDNQLIVGVLRHHRRPLIDVFLGFGQPGTVRLHCFVHISNRSRMADDFFHPPQYDQDAKHEWIPRTYHPRIRRMGSSSRA